MSGLRIAMMGRSMALKMPAAHSTANNAQRLLGEIDVKRSSLVHRAEDTALGPQQLECFPGTNAGEGSEAIILERLGLRLECHDDLRS
jgi:hypothetical protein